MMRGVMIAFIVLILMSAALWIGSIHVEYPNRLALIWIGIFWDLFVTGSVVSFVRASERLESTWIAPIARVWQISPLAS